MHAFGVVMCCRGAAMHAAWRVLITCWCALQDDQATDAI
jgi:hypothetical protein